MSILKNDKNIEKKCLDFILMALAARYVVEGRIDIEVGLERFFQTYAGQYGHGHYAAGDFIKAYQSMQTGVSCHERLKHFLLAPNYIATSNYFVGVEHHRIAYGKSGYSEQGKINDCDAVRIAMLTDDCCPDFDAFFEGESVLYKDVIKAFKGVEFVAWFESNKYDDDWQKVADKLLKAKYRETFPDIKLLITKNKKSAGWKRYINELEYVRFQVLAGIAQALLSVHYSFEWFSPQQEIDTEGTVTFWSNHVAEQEKTLAAIETVCSYLGKWSESYVSFDRHIWHGQLLAFRDELEHQHSLLKGFRTVQYPERSLLALRVFLALRYIGINADDVGTSALCESIVNQILGLDEAEASSDLIDTGKRNAAEISLNSWQMNWLKTAHPTPTGNFSQEP